LYANFYGKFLSGLGTRQATDQGTTVDNTSTYSNFFYSAREDLDEIVYGTDITYSEESTLNRIVLDNSDVIVAVLGVGNIVMDKKEVPCFAYAIQSKASLKVRCVFNNFRAGGIELDEDPMVLDYEDYPGNTSAVISYYGGGEVSSYEGGTGTFVLTDADTGDLLGTADFILE